MFRGLWFLGEFPVYQKVPVSNQCHVHPKGFYPNYCTMTEHKHASSKYWVLGPFRGGVVRSRDSVSGCR